MPTLETADGKPVITDPASPATVNANFRAVMDDDGPDDKAPPKRADRPPAERPKRGRPSNADKARTTAARPAVSLGDAERAQGVQGFAQIGAGLALMYGKATGKSAYEADAVAIANAAPQFADAAVQIAKADAGFAARLDKVCASGPYAALIAVGVNVTLQCIRNHRPAMVLPGTVHPDDLLNPSEVNPDDQAVPAAA